MTNSPIQYNPPSGPYPVGVRDGELNGRGEDRPDIETRLMVRVWYPAGASQGAPRRYLIGRERQILSWFVEATGNMIPADWIGRLAAIRTHSVVDAAVAEGRFPMLVFSHGGFSHVAQNTPLMEHLASHGYVVWSVAHPGGSGGVLYPNGDLARYDDAFHQRALAMTTDTDYFTKVTGDEAARFAATARFVDDWGIGRWQARWADDMLSVVDAVHNRGVTGQARVVADACELDRVGMLGMSLGGAAAVSAAHRDHRNSAAVNLDGGQFLSDLLNTDVRVPVLQLTSDFAAQMRTAGVEPTAADFNEFFYEPARTAGQRRDVQRLRFEGVTHLEFTDLALLPAADRARALPGAGQVTSQHIVDVISRFTLAQFDAVLQGRDNGYPQAQLDAHPQVQTIDVTRIRRWAQPDLQPEPA